MITEGKVIVTAPDGRRFVIVGAEAVFKDIGGRSHLFVMGSGVSCKLEVRQIRRDAKGRKFKEGGK